MELRAMWRDGDLELDEQAELWKWLDAERDRANTAEAQCAELTIENLQLAVKAGMMADIPETELRARTAGRIAEVEDKLAVAETRAREAVARAERAETSLRLHVLENFSPYPRMSGDGSTEREQMAIDKLRAYETSEATAILEMSEEHHRMTIAFEQSAAKARTARADAFAEVVANLRFSGVLDPAQMGVVEWCANRIEELGKKGEG